ncbi:MAG: HNH endonuclease [Planctomycetota bacterium]
MAIISRCERCGKRFKHDKGKPGKHCSRRCRFAASPEERFWSYVTKAPPGECWEWQGVRSGDGYGAIRWPGFSYKIGAHRASWMVRHGPIRGDQWILHRCDNPPCVNPDHLYLGDASQNMKDAYERGGKVAMHGSKSPNAKLSAGKVKEMRQRHRGGESAASMCADYGVSKATAHRAIVGISWRHVL